MDGGVVHEEGVLVAFGQAPPLLAEAPDDVLGLVGVVLAVDEDLSTVGRDEGADSDVKERPLCLPIPDERPAFDRPSVVVAVSLVEDGLVDLDDVVAFASPVHDGLLGVLEVRLLSPHLPVVGSWRSKLGREPLERDAGSVVEFLQVLRGQIAALIFPLVVVDGDSICQCLGGNLLKMGVAGDQHDLWLSDVEQLGWPTSTVLHLPDASFTVEVEDVDDQPELVLGGVQCLRRCPNGDAGLLSCELLLLRVVDEEHEQGRLEVEHAVVALVGAVSLHKWVLFHRFLLV